LILFGKWVANRASHQVIYFVVVLSCLKNEIIITVVDVLIQFLNLIFITVFTQKAYTFYCVIFWCMSLQTHSDQNLLLHFGGLSLTRGTRPFRFEAA
jgi:hypothetical protein